MNDTCKSLSDQIGAKTQLDARSIDLRRKIICMLECSKRGHVGATFSVVEILRVLYDDVLKYDSSNPAWIKRDRCILSKGHGCLAQYVLLGEKGFFPADELEKFCQSNGILGGHPDALKVPGIEASTGALGHGLPIGVGMAVFGQYSKSNHRIFVVVGDGECNEGSVWEAALSAGNRHLSNLCVLVDYNKQQSYDTTFYVQNLEPFMDKWRAFGFSVAEVDGHDVPSLRKILIDVPLNPDRPSAIICHTVKGKGIPFVENNLNWHHKNRLKDEEITALYDALKGN